MTDQKPLPTTELRVYMGRRDYFIADGKVRHWWLYPATLDAAEDLTADATEGAKGGVKPDFKSPVIGGVYELTHANPEKTSVYISGERGPKLVGHVSTATATTWQLADRACAAKVAHQKKVRAAIGDSFEETLEPIKAALRAARTSDEKNFIRALVFDTLANHRL